MKTFKTYYTTSSKSENSGSFKELLEKVKKGNDVKIKLNVCNRTGKDKFGKIYTNKRDYEEIIPFVNIAYNNKDIVGLVPYHRASSSSYSFSPKKKNYYDTPTSSYVHPEYNCFFSYCTNETSITLRTNNNKISIAGDKQQSTYALYQWISTDDDWQLAFETDKDSNNTAKKNYLIESLKNGQNVKVEITLNNWNYILNPQILYFYKDTLDSVSMNVSMKTYPIILYGEKIYKDDVDYYQESELMVCSDGKTSVAKTIKHKMTYKQNNIIKKLYYFFKKKILFFEKKTEYEGLNLNTKWFLKK